MGTIAEEITRIQTAKSNIKTAIENKGVAVGDITIDGYATLINQITTGEGGGKWALPTGIRFSDSTLSNIDVSGIDTTNTTSFEYLFSSCNKLQTITGIENWNTSNLTNVGYMFYFCGKLASLDLSSWNTSNLTRAEYMFYYCQELTTLDLSNWDVSNVTNLNSTFYYCPSLTTLTGIENWDVSNLTNAEYMFCYCQALTSLDLSSWNPTVKSINYYNMFKNCTSLTDLDISSLDLGNTNTSDLIAGCTNLVNFNCGKNIKRTMDISTCSSLSVDSIMSIINNYYDYTANGETTSYYLAISQAQSDMLTDEQKAILTNKGVSFSIS